MIILYNERMLINEVMMVIIKVIMFIVAVGMGGITNLENNWLIGPDDCTFIRVGAKYG